MTVDKPALAIAEEERIHRLVVKLNTVIERATGHGIGTKLVVTEESPDSIVRLDVRTVFSQEADTGQPLARRLMPPP